MGSSYSILVHEESYAQERGGPREVSTMLFLLTPADPMPLLPSHQTWRHISHVRELPVPDAGRMGRANASIVTNGAHTGLGVGEFLRERYRSGHRTLPTGATHRFVPHCAPA